MKDITLAVITKLKANTTLCSSTYVGATPNQRVYRASLPQLPTFPCIAVTKIDSRRLNLYHNGRRIGQSRVQCTTFATKEVDAATISELIADTLHGLTSTTPGVGVYVVRVDDGGERVDADPNLGKYLYHRDFLIQHYY
jgi:hypothetical protein